MSEKVHIYSGEHKTYRRPGGHADKRTDFRSGEQIEQGSTTRERFTIDNPVAGFIEAHGKRADAQERAASLAKLTGITHHVYDRMARVGAVEQWSFNERGEVFETRRRENR